MCVCVCADWRMLLLSLYVVVRSTIAHVVYKLIHYDTENETNILRRPSHKNIFLNYGTK